MAGSVAAQSGARPGYNVEFLGPPLADPVMQYNKESYVMYGCAYCHGVNLVPRGEAVDLRRSPLVGADVDGSLIVKALRAGFPNTTRLSPMPQYSDLSEQQLQAIAAWIHYARQRDRYAALTEAPPQPGNAVSGGRAFEQACSGCHSARGDLAEVGTKYGAAGLRAQILEPDALRADPSFSLARPQDARRVEARKRHQSLLENYSPEQVADLVAYLQAPR
jgi:mono/diheme cytochrome c family protein